MRILITGGAGFVGSRLALHFRHDYPDADIVVLDNLKRRGAEINLPVLQQAGITFAYGDIRTASDLFDLNQNFDLFVEASAEPSVQAGLDGSPAYVLQTNLVGTLNCLEFARKHCASIIFLSTSRVYSIAPLRAIKLDDAPTRFEIAPNQAQVGVTPQGISEDFSTREARSLYGASKLASELILQEYADTYKLPSIINRCGVIAGPGQFGKVDQGVFTLWVANHHFGKPLRYTGFGGEGKQVRDLLHPSDLYRLIKMQAERASELSGKIYNVGGGRPVSVSLAELTGLCEKVTGRQVPITQNDVTSPVDIPLYLSDCAQVERELGWKAEKSVEQIIGEIGGWLRENETALRPLFAP